MIKETWNDKITDEHRTNGYADPKKLTDNHYRHYCHDSIYLVKTSEPFEEFYFTDENKALHFIKENWGAIDTFYTKPPSDDILLRDYINRKVLR